MEAIVRLARAAAAVGAGARVAVRGGAQLRLAVTQTRRVTSTRFVAVAVCRRQSQCSRRCRSRRRRRRWRRDEAQRAAAGHAVPLLAGVAAAAIANASTAAAGVARVARADADDDPSALLERRVAAAVVVVQLIVVVEVVRYGREATRVANAVGDSFSCYCSSCLLLCVHLWHIILGVDSCWVVLTDIAAFAVVVVVQIDVVASEYGACGGAVDGERLGREANELRLLSTRLA